MINPSTESDLVSPRRITDATSRFSHMLAHAGLGVLAAAGVTVGVFGTPAALAATAPHPAAESRILAADPEFYSENVVDKVGVLTPDKVSEISSKIKDFKLSHHRSIFIVFVDDFGSRSAEDWTREAVRINGGNNVALLAVSPSRREVGLYAGSEWSSSQRQAMYDAAYPHLVDSDWAGGALAAIDAAGKGTSGRGAAGSSSSADKTTKAEDNDDGIGGILAVGGAGAAIVGGGAWAYARRNRKKRDHKILEQSRTIDPRDSQAILELPLHTLEERANEELVSTDESIRRGREELDLAVAEFGPERTRTFTRAMNHSTTTLQRAFELKRQYDSGEVTDDAARSLLAEIVSSCGSADAALDKEAASFADLRNLLVNAPQRLDTITQQTVDLRARLPLAKQTMEQLRKNYDASVLTSIAHNPELAEGAIVEAEKNLEQGRSATQLPAGKQGGVIDAIRAAEHAVTTADKLLGAIERADDNISTATAHVDDLIAEVRSEIAELDQLIANGTKRGVDADWEDVQKQRESFASIEKEASQRAAADPLYAYGQLIDADTKLDELLDTLRESTANRERLQQLYNKQISHAATEIEAAEDLISARGRVVRGSARTKLAEAKRLMALAQYNSEKEIRKAISLARQAAEVARKARKRAEKDMDNYEDKHRKSSGGGGELFLGMLLGELLFSGGSSRGGGFGGGFSGGRF